MIGWLSGVILDREPQVLTLDVNGVGYEVEISAEILGQGGYASGDELAVWIHSHATSENPNAVLFGFLTSEQRRIFRLLLRVKGIGPRLAQAVVGQLGSEGLVEAVGMGDVKRLTTVSGVGKKTAQQIILDLAGKVTAIVKAPAKLQGEQAAVTSALTNLGFRRAQVDRALKVLRERGQLEGTFDELLRRALVLLGEM